MRSVFKARPASHKRHMRRGHVAMVSMALFCSAHAAAQPAPGSRLSVQALRAAYGLSSGHVTNIAGIEIYYADEGKGPVILLCNGSSSSLRTWDGLTAALKANYRVIRWDIPPGDMSGSIPKQLLGKVAPAAIPEGLLGQLHISHVAAAIGVSAGGTMVVQLAARRPDLVDRLILSNAPADPVHVEGMVLSPALKRETDAAKVTGFHTQAYWNAFFDFFAGVPGRIPSAMRTQFYDMNRRSPEPDPLGMAATVADHAKAVKNFAAIHAPTLLVWGERDPLLTPPSAKVLADYLVNTQVSEVLLPDVGHYPPIEVPERFAKIVRDYIETATPVLAPY